MNAARACLVALMLCWAFAALADVAVPPLTGRVVDKTATLSGSDVASLDKTLKDFEARKGSQVAVLIVPTTQPETIEQYSLRVAESWKIGRKKVDDGAIFVVAKDDRKLRIEVGYGLEGALTDVTAKRIIDEVITPKFRGGDFAGGISDGVDRILRVIDGEPLPALARKPQQQGSDFDPGDLLNPFVIAGLFFLGGFLRRNLGPLPGAAATGGLAGVIIWFVSASLAFSLIGFIGVFVITLFSGLVSSSSGGFGGGSSSSGGFGGGYSGGSSSDSGGFSGGGGSFGGGGASGSW